LLRWQFFPTDHFSSSWFTVWHILAVRTTVASILENGITWRLQPVFGGTTDS
jgi:hypothetical protein